MHTPKVWKAKLHKVYTDFDEFERYDKMYNLAERLGFSHAEAAWDANPLIQGSTNPADYKVVIPKSQKVSGLYLSKKVDNGIDLETGECVRGCCEGDTSGSGKPKVGRSKAAKARKLRPYIAIYLDYTSQASPEYLDRAAVELRKILDRAGWHGPKIEVHS